MDLTGSLVTTSTGPYSHPRRPLPNAWAGYGFDHFLIKQFQFGKGYMTMLEKSRAKDERMRMEQAGESIASASNLPNLHKTPGMSAQGTAYEK